MIIQSRLPLVLALAAALSLVACSEAPPPPAETAAPVEAAPAVAAPAPLSALDVALAAPARSPDNVARDAFRHPRETLGFFGIEPGMTVIEITPGGGWYTEILAPLLRGSGEYVGAIVDPATLENEGARNYNTASNEKLRAKLAADPEAYDKASLVEFDPAAPAFGAADSADRILTFRNVHNWMGQKQAQGMFNGFFAALKPGGVLGVVEHRAAEDVPEGNRSGYVSEQQVIAFATAAGFQLAEKSEINANPKDTRDHPNGVWTLPPSLRLPEGDDGQKFRDIGESDRMTLKFIKPEAAPMPADG